MSGLERKSDNTSTMSGTPSLHRDGTLAGSEAISSQRKGRSLFLKLFGLFSLIISLWALATPLMAFPDEPAHTIKAAAVVRNQITVQEGMSFGHGIHVKVPAYIANLDAQRCYKYRPDTSAGCAPVIPADDNYETIGVTTAGTYNPMYYWIVGLPSLWLTGAPALYAMRIVSSILTAAFLAAGFTALSRFLRPQIPVLLASVSMTPMVLFLGSGINPNSLEVAATMAAFCGFIVLLDNAHRPQAVIPAVVTVVAASTILANTRQVSLIWLLCALMVGLSFYQRRSIFAAFRNKLVLTAVAATVPGVVLGIVWILLMLNAPASAGVAPIGIINPMPGVRADQGFVTMLDRFFGFFPQYVGVMGWLDSRLPDAVQMFWSFLFVVALLLPVAVRPLRRTAGYWLALVLLLVIPAALQAQVVTSMGFIWQGRYNLPLFLVLLISAGIACRHLRISQSEGAQTIGRIVVVAAIAAHGLAFAYILRRYVVGIRELANWQIMITKPEWQPPLGWLVLIAAYVVLMALAGHFLFKFVFPGALLFRRRSPVLSGEPKTTAESINPSSTIAEAHSRSRT